MYRKEAAITLKKIRFGLTLLGLLLMGSVSFAEDHLTLIHALEYKPYYYSTSAAGGKRQSRGFLVDVIQGAAEGANIEIDFRIVDGWTRSLNLVRLDRADGMFPLFKTPERQEYMTFPEKAILAKEINIAVSLKSRRLTFDGTYGSHRYHVFGVIHNYSYGSEFDNAHIRRQTAGNERELLRLLHGGEPFDFIVGNRAVLRYLAEEMNITSDLTFHPYELSNDPLYLAFADDRVPTETASRLAQAIAAYKQTPAYADLLARFRAGKL